MIPISSRQNPQVKALVALKEASERRRQSAFIVEGLRELQVAAANALVFKSLWVCPELLKKEAPLEALKQRAEQTFQVPASVFEKLSCRQNPDGLLAELLGSPRPLSSLGNLTPNPLVLVLEGLEKPGNIGAIIRSAEALGVTALLISDPLCDLYNPHLIRNSQGLVFALNIAVCTQHEALAFFKKQHITLLSTQATPTAKAPWDHNLRGPTAIILGNEHSGVTPFWQPHALGLRIPQVGQADSLNVAVAASIIIAEACRQREF